MAYYYSGKVESTGGTFPTNPETAAQINIIGIAAGVSNEPFIGDWIMESGKGIIAAAEIAREAYELTDGDVFGISWENEGGGVCIFEVVGGVVKRYTYGGKIDDTVPGE